MYVVDISVPLIYVFKSFLQYFMRLDVTTFVY